MTQTATQRIAAAQSGDQQAFSDLVEPYRAELLVHCYRLLGSPQDAEDMVQETLLRAWNHLDRFTGGAYFRAWLYKIATNACLDVLDRRSRRLLSPVQATPSDPSAPLTPPNPELLWLEPFPDELLPDSALGPEARYSLRESITLAFLAALQLLPPRQRVTLILCDVLDWRASDVAQLLDTTVSAVNSALHRARATMTSHYTGNDAALSLDGKVRGVLKRYLDAWESGDVDTLVTLLAENIVFAMPPMSEWYRGSAAVRVMATALLRPDQWRLRETRANNQIAFAFYQHQDDGSYHFSALQLIKVDDGKLSDVQMFFLPQIAASFGLPAVLAA
ncbi:MAG TPA: RNA polymerase subunit sigma-70 [Phototrophicaceae bacterium]|nr:RNA polymerase subunit sigma-70 [Phototrophicaceae bacterium]